MQSRQPKSEITKAKILSASESEFSEKGFFGARIDEIAERAGINKRMIYEHFESKENLIAICVQRIVNKVLMSFAPDKKDYTEPDGLTDKQRLISFAQQTFEYFERW